MLQTTKRWEHLHAHFFLSMNHVNCRHHDFVAIMPHNSINQSRSIQQNCEKKTFAQSPNSKLKLRCFDDRNVLKNHGTSNRVEVRCTETVGVSIMLFLCRIGRNRCQISLKLQLIMMLRFNLYDFAKFSSE